MTKPPKIRLNTPEEEARIQAAIANDPDASLSTKPLPPKRRRGRPSGSSKTHVNIRLDNEVLEALKTPDARGWQTRLNAVLRQALKL